MGTHWTDKRTAVAMLGAEMARRGWKLYGWKEDRSDSMTDYYEPESWRGLAERDGFVLVVDSGPSDPGGHQPVKSASDVVGACDRCNGTGDDPSGWTYQRAKESPREYNADTCKGTGAFVVFADVVSPLHFRDYGPELCRKCHGGGKVYGNHRMEPDGPRWPEHKGNPKGRAWHVERGGVILASGVGVFAVADEKYDAHHVCSADNPNDDASCERCGETGRAWELRGQDCPAGRPKLRALADRIETACRVASAPVTMPDHGGMTHATVDGVEVSEGKRPGYVDVRFPSKPRPDVIAALKAAGFRWAPSFGCWYGKREAIPAGLVMVSA